MLEALRLKNLLILVSHWPPENVAALARRAVKIAKYLPEHGWNPIVITAERVEEAPYDDSYAHDADALEVIRCRVPTLRRFFGNTRFGRALEVPDAHAGWIPTAIAAGNRLAKARRVDAIWSLVPPVSTLAIAAALRRVHKMPWVCDLHDAVIDSPYYYRQHRFLRMLQAAWERRFLPRADTFTGSSRGLLRAAHDRYGVPEGTFIPNSYDEDDFKGIVPDRSDGRWTIAHIGSLPHYRNPEALIAALSILVRRGLMKSTDIRLRFIGYLSGDARKALETASSGVLRGAVEIEPVRPHREALRDLVSADLLLLFETREDKYDSVYQLKCSGYLRAPAPILAISPPNQMTQAIEETGRGRAVWPSEPERIAEALLEAYQRRAPRPVKLFGPAPGVERFSSQAAAAALAEVLNGLPSKVE